MRWTGGRTRRSSAPTGSSASWTSSLTPTPSPSTSSRRCSRRSSGSRRRSTSSRHSTSTRRLNNNRRASCASLRNQKTDLMVRARQSTYTSTITPCLVHSLHRQLIYQSLFSWTCPTEYNNLSGPVPGSLSRTFKSRRCSGLFSGMTPSGRTPASSRL
ncbi:hypothetical protein BRADI_1g66893v3 [Brachypodium distachyon]|uniref:Uncharacterized protein n=1 Tax=Brachypodium distachyon TaxID=15368 RepID=A0A2K2DTS0_BRADI|nr:hypothetical protein BRADI_1g66893v3 [Brachypodium distachyon]